MPQSDSETKKDKTEPPRGSDDKDARAQRLAQRLRENLRRRKAQARGRDQRDTDGE